MHFLIVSVSFILGAMPPAELLNQNKDLLFEQLRSSAPDVRINALQKISDLRFPDGPAKLMELLTDPDAEVRFMAVRLVGKNQNPESLKALQGLIAAEKDPYLLSEIRRNIRSIEDTIKALEKAKEKASEPKAPAKKSTKSPATKK